MQPDSFINVHLIEPVERLWGRLISITAAGVTVRGMNVKEVESFKYQGPHRNVFPQTFFFPMRRVVKLDLDEAMDLVPSVIDSIVAVSGQSKHQILQSE